MLQSKKLTLILTLTRTQTLTLTVNPNHSNRNFLFCGAICEIKIKLVNVAVDLAHQG